MAAPGRPAEPHRPRIWLDDGGGRGYFGDAAGERGELFRAGTLGAAELGDLRARHQQWLEIEAAVDP